MAELVLKFLKKHTPLSVTTTSSEFGKLKSELLALSLPPAWEGEEQASWVCTECQDHSWGPQTSWHPRHHLLGLVG